MPTLYHAPQSRSSTAVTLIDALGATDVEIREVTIPRFDGSGAPDADNPHPEKKVPFVVDGTDTVREQGAIMLYLTDRYPEAGLGPRPGDPTRGAYLSWLFYYQGVMEPLIILRLIGISHPRIAESLRDYEAMLARLNERLAAHDWLVGDSYTAADLLCSAAFTWMPGLMPESAAIRDWVARAAAQPASRRAAEREARAL